MSVIRGACNPNMSPGAILSFWEIARNDQYHLLSMIFFLL